AGKPRTRAARHDGQAELAGQLHHFDDFRGRSGKNDQSRPGVKARQRVALVRQQLTGIKDAMLATDDRTELSEHLSFHGRHAAIVIVFQHTANVTSFPQGKDGGIECTSRTTTPPAVCSSRRFWQPCRSWCCCIRSPCTPTATNAASNTSALRRLTLRST